jgi:hypothetical protein
MNDESLYNEYLLTKGIIEHHSEQDEPEIIPAWDRRITWDEGDDYWGPSCVFKHVRVKLIDIIFNIKTRELSLGTTFNLYPTKFAFELGEQVYAKQGDGVYKTSIKDIKYTPSYMQIFKGKHIEDYQIKRIKASYPDAVIENNNLYCIQDWKASYLLEDDRLINYETLELFKVLDK